MKRILFILFYLILFACSSIKETYSFSPNYHFYKETETPQLVIDSISNADSLKLDSIKYWNKIEVFTSDSCIQRCHYNYNDSLKYSISIMKLKNNKYIIKYIHE